MNRAQLPPSFPRVSALRQPFTVYTGITEHVELRWRFESIFMLRVYQNKICSHANLVLRDNAEFGSR